MQESDSHTASGLFKEGWAGGPGRPKGQKDKKWQSLQALWDMLMSPEIFGKLRPNQQATILADMIKLHTSRILAHLPQTLDEKEAKEAMAQTTQELLNMVSKISEKKP